MTSACKACNNIGIIHHMVNIFSHPNQIDIIFNQISGIQVKENDYLCIPCYDEMKIAYNFRQKCIQSELFRCNSLKAQKILNENVERDDFLIKESETSTSSDNDEKTRLQINEFSTLDYNDKSQETCSNLQNSSDVFLNIQVKEKVQHSDVTKEEKFNTTNERYSCNHCEISFSREKLLTKHINDNHLKNDDENLVNKEINIKKKRGPILKYPDEDIFQGLLESQCEYCFVELPTVEEKEKHEKQHKTENKPYKCKFGDCTSEFKEKYGLRNHVRIHSEFKRYKCKFCDHRFHQRGNIISHERLHTGEKPFLCPHCGKSFAESGNLKAHIRFHTGERPYSCSECPKKFKTHYSHKIHFRSHTQERPYLCSECGKSFFSSGKLLVHKRIHSGQRPYKCKFCPANFMDSSGLKRHSKIH